MRKKKRKVPCVLIGFFLAGYTLVRPPSGGLYCNSDPAPVNVDCSRGHGNGADGWVHGVGGEERLGSDGHFVGSQGSADNSVGSDISVGVGVSARWGAAAGKGSRPRVGGGGSSAGRGNGVWQRTQSGSLRRMPSRLVIAPHESAGAQASIPYDSPTSPSGGDSGSTSNGGGGRLRSLVGRRASAT